ncbi:MAG: hypothetical protein GXP62_11300 [Oligoflexia bacterium]|nr:hypothetical protein [Oligoflexia bacterium]
MPDPVVSAVHPDWGFNGEDTQIEVGGQSFFPRVQISGSNRVEQDHQFAVVLGTDPETQLGTVELVDYRHILAIVPAGLPVGSYDLRVESPTGAAGILEDAFEVRDTRADQIRVTPAQGQLSWIVQEYAALTIELVDPDGQRVAEDIEVRVTVDDAEPDTISFQDDTLLDQVPLSDGTGIGGRLGPDGTATVALTSKVSTEAVIVRIDGADPSSTVEGALQILSFVPGDVAGLQILLPSPVFDTVAGTSFDIDLSVVDEGGNVVDGADTVLVIQELCSGGTLYQPTSFVGEITGQPVSVTRASVDGCDANAIVAYGISGGSAVQGQSNLFSVAAGDPVGLDLDVWPDQVVAGQEELLTAITAVDEWSNRAVSVEGAVDLQASVQGGAFSPPAWSQCYDLIEGASYCRSLLDIAGEDVVLSATTAGSDGLVGVSASFTVLPGAATDLVVSVDPATVVAGETFSLSIQAQDAFGNSVTLDPLGADPASFDDPQHDAECDWDHTADSDDIEVYACVAVVAGDDRVVTVTVPSLGLSGQSDPFAITNAALATVAVSLATTSVVAGQPLTVGLVASDAYDNPYTVQDDPVLDLADTTVDVSPVSVVLDGDGTASFDVVITVAVAEDTLTLSQAGVTLGSSTSFAVLAGPSAGLELALERTFAWLDQPLQGVLSAVDSYGNVATDYSGSPTLRSAEGWGDPVVIPALDAGVLAVSYQWLQKGLGDGLIADDGAFRTTVTVDVLDSACASPPTAALTVDDQAPAVLCTVLTTGSTRTVTVSAEDSVAGSASLSRYHLRDEDGQWFAGGSSTWSRSWDTVGGRTLGVVVADDNACADAADVDVFVGSPDGTPTGPVDVSLASSSLTAGDSGADGMTTATLSATDCAGDPPTTATLLVRADLGAIDTSSGTVTATGSGLELTLDATGVATLVWSMAEERADGQASLFAGSEDAVAFGQAQALVINDSVRPAVISLDPYGTTAASFDSIQVQFSEDILSSTVSTDAVRLFDPDGLAVSLIPDDLAVSGGDLLISMPGTQDASLGVWTLQLDSTLRDLDGNRLDGTWTDTRSAFAMDFGVVTDSAPDLASCWTDTDIVRPDGDDGFGDQADFVVMTVSAGAVPDWWRLQVSSADGQLVRTIWTPEGSASSASLSWDARGQDGLVVQNGDYLLVVSPADLYWNVGTSCSATVTVDNLLVSP